MLNLPTLLHVIPAAMLHDTLLVMWRDVGCYEEVFQLDLSSEDVYVLQQVFPLPLKAALKVCCLCSLALVAALQLLQLALLLLDFVLLQTAKLTPLCWSVVKLGCNSGQCWFSLLPSLWGGEQQHQLDT